MNDWRLDGRRMGHDDEKHESQAIKQNVIDLNFSSA